MVLVIYGVYKMHIGSKIASHKTGSTRRKYFKGVFNALKKNTLKAAYTSAAGCCRSWSPKMHIALTCCLQQQFTYHPLLSWPVDGRSQWKHILVCIIDFLVWDIDQSCNRLRQTKKNRVPLT